MNHEGDRKRLAAHFTTLFREHGDTPAAAQWADQATQEARFDALLGVGDVTRAKVLDFGCGTGHLLTVLQARGFEGEYVGYDLAEDLVVHARQKFAGSGARFEVRDVRADGVGEDFDYVLVSGVFNNGIAEAWVEMQATLRTLFARTRVALAFNNLSTYVDFFQPDLFYVDPGEVFRFAKERLSPRVTLRHDYQVRPGVLPYEFTTYVHASDIACRERKTP